MTEMVIGARYRTRDGRKTGKLRECEGLDGYPFAAKIDRELFSFSINGSRWVGTTVSGHDLIEKLPPKVKKPAPTPDITESAAVAKLTEEIRLYKAGNQQLEILLAQERMKTPPTDHNAALLAEVNKISEGWYIDQFNTDPHRTMCQIRHTLKNFTPPPSEAEATLKRVRNIMSDFRFHSNLSNEARTVTMRKIIEELEPIIPYVDDASDTPAPAEPELLPCPFDNEYSKGHCLICKAEGPVKDTTEQEAITAWNTRAQPPQTTTLANDREQLIWDIIAAANTANGMGLGLSGQFEAVSKALPDAQPPRLPNDKLVDNIEDAAFASWKPKHGAYCFDRENFRTYLQSVLPPDEPRGEVVWYPDMAIRLETLAITCSRTGIDLERYREEVVDILRAAAYPATPTGEPR